MNVRKVLAKSVNQQVAESATGICARAPAGGQFYDGNGDKISDTAARRLFRAGEVVEVPNAGAGSYDAVCARLGFTDVKVEDWSSSAGDWCFRVRSGLVFQENRYPNFGFKYTYQRDARLRDLA